jgi:hypothetical protein
MSFGFDKLKKPDPPDRNLDLSGLRMNPPVPPVEKEKKALAKGEKLGFSSRESGNATTGQGRVERRRQHTANRSIFIKGPEAVLDRFVAYTNELGVDAYWQALEKLLNEKDK